VQYHTNVKSDKWRNDKFEKTRKISEYLKAQGHGVVEMWESDFVE